MPKVSVVIPSYNRPQFLIQAINNLTEQSYKDFEILVIDSSDDNTKDMLQLYMPLIRYIYQPKQGRSAAKNLGMLVAQGEYVAFIDCDDLWHPTKIEKQVDILDKHPEIGFVYTNQLKETGKERFQIRADPSRIVSGSIHSAILKKDIYVSTSSLMIRKKCIEIAGMFDSSLSEQEDWDFPLRLSRYFKGWGIKEPLTIKRLRGDEKSDEEFELMRVRAMQQVLARESLSAVLRSVLAVKLAGPRLHFYWGRVFFKHQRFVESRQEFLRSWRKGPWRLDAIACFLLTLSGRRLFRLSLKLVDALPKLKKMVFHKI